MCVVVRPLVELLRGPDETDVEWLLRRAGNLRRAKDAVDVAFACAGQGERERAAWDRALRTFRVAVDVMYPEEFWSDARRLAEGDPMAVEPALVFLEADPWCFRSGYAKATLVRRLGRHRLTPDHRDRLACVLVHVVEAGDRREFRFYCNLAAKNASQTLRVGLKDRLCCDEPGVRRGALLMLLTMRHPRLNPSEMSRARRIILGGARRRDHPFWRHSGGRLTRRFWTRERGVKSW